MTNLIRINSSSSLVKEFNTSNKEELTESEAQDLVRKINNSKRGKAYIESNEVKVKDLLIG